MNQKYSNSDTVEPMGSQISEKFCSSCGKDGLEVFYSTHAFCPDCGTEKVEPIYRCPIMYRDRCYKPMRTYKFFLRSGGDIE